MNGNLGRTRATLLAIVAVVLAAAAVFWYYRSRREVVPPPPPMPPVVLARPRMADLTSELPVGGILEAERTVTVLPRVSGLLLDLLVEEGDSVAKGQVIARIDPVPYDLELASAESAYLLTESLAIRTERLFDSSGASRQQLDEVKVSRDAALSSYELAKLRREYADITAPFGGTVLRRLVDPGAMVSPEVPVVVVGETDRLIVKAQVSEKYYHRFLALQGAAAAVLRPDDPQYGYESSGVEGTVLRISPAVSPGAKSFTVTVGIESPPDSWRPGMRVKPVFILDRRSRVWTLPVSALGNGDELWWVDTAQGTAHRLPVEGSFVAGDFIEVPVEYGGKNFVVDGQHRLTEGQKVTVLEDI